MNPYALPYALPYDVARVADEAVRLAGEYLYWAIGYDAGRGEL